MCIYVYIYKETNFVRHQKDKMYVICRQMDVSCVKNMMCSKQI